MGIRSSVHSVRFGQLLRCAHKRIVDIMKVYTFTFAKREGSLCTIANE